MRDAGVGSRMTLEDDAVRVLAFFADRGARAHVEIDRRGPIPAYAQRVLRTMYEAAADLNERAAGSAAGSDDEPNGTEAEPSLTSVETLGVSEIAEAAGVSTRAVRKACEGALHSYAYGGGNRPWRVRDCEPVRQWIARPRKVRSEAEGLRRGS